MPGRQAHGRSLLTTHKAKNSSKKSRTRSRKNALNAFGIAQERFPSRQKKTPRTRQLDAESERKHARDEDGEAEDDDQLDEEPKRKRPKGLPGTTDEEDGEHGSDSEGNEWRMGGLAQGHEDSEIESDDAFGDSDDDKFDGYQFRGSKSKKAATDDSEDDSNDDEGETLGADAIDLATALDQFEEEDSEAPMGDEKAASEESDGSTSEPSDEFESDDEDHEADAEQLEALRGLVSEYGGEGADEAATQPHLKRKIELGDLGLAGIDDPFLKRSVKLMNKEGKEKRPGAAKKLDVPLPKRQQDRQDRAVAYEKTKETLDRWTETVKQNRRADHLIFPLPQNSATAGLDMTEMQTLSTKCATNELETTIMSIMEQSGLSMQKQGKPKPQEFDDEGNLLSRKEAMKRRRMQRDIMEREAKRAKRIKKIKSKAYHRVHRKQRERDEMAAKEAMEEAGEIDSEAEREAQDRRRALERVGQRHKESKWAKMGSKTKRAVWDDDFRQGLTEMARKDEELRRRKEGKKGGVDYTDSDTSSSSGDDDGDETLRRRLDELDAEERDEPQSTLMSMKFMQKAEAARKKANDDLVQQIRRELDGDEAGDSESDSDEVDEVGRRSFGGAAVAATRPALDTTKRRARRDEDMPRAQGHSLTATRDDMAPASTPSGEAATTAGAWSRGEARRSKRKGAAGGRVEELDLGCNVLVAKGPVKAKAKASVRPSLAKARVTTEAGGGGGDKDEDEDEDDDASTSDADSHLPLAVRDQELLARAFAGEDVVGDFAREKAAVAEADDDKVIDHTLPGWGSWVGEGVGSREKSRHQGRFLTKVEGIKKQDRKDAKLERVIINEKRVKKNARYLASQLPHPFESRQQYERSLRLPIGPEWVTKSSFQQGTKPRVLMKQGVIAPMSKPTA